MKVPCRISADKIKTETQPPEHSLDKILVQYNPKRKAQVAQVAVTNNASRLLMHLLALPSTGCDIAPSHQQLTAKPPINPISRHLYIYEAHAYVLRGSQIIKSSTHAPKPKH